MNPENQGAGNVNNEEEINDIDDNIALDLGAGN